VYLEERYSVYKVFGLRGKIFFIATGLKRQKVSSSLEALHYLQVFINKNES